MKIYSCSANGKKWLYVIARSEKRAKYLYKRAVKCTIEEIRIRRFEVDVDDDEQECTISPDSDIARSYGVEYVERKRIQMH